MRLGILSDTHVTGTGRRRIPAGCLERLAESDLVIHAGDLVTSGVLDDLEALGPPVVAVHGNRDEPAVVRRLPEVARVPTPAGPLAVVHDAGPAAGRLARLRRRFPDCVAVVFGHSHIPLLEKEDGFAIFNPGSPTDKRRQPRFTMGAAHVADGRVRFEVVPL